MYLHPFFDQVLTLEQMPAAGDTDVVKCAKQTVVKYLVI